MRTVLTFSEAVESHGRAHVRRMLRTGVWQRPAPNAHVTHNGPLNEFERAEVARIASGPRAKLAGLSALAVDGYDVVVATRPYIVLPIGARRPAHTDLVVHWSSMLDERDVHPRREPVRTRPARSIIDAASWAASDVQARLIVISTLQRGLATPRLLREALQRRGTCRRRALIVESILDARGGIQSLPERSFREVCVVHRLPPPSRQRALRTKGGRFYLDVEWLKYGVAAEIHGVQHREVGHWDRDLVRGNEIVISGRRVVAFSSFAVRHRPALVGDQLRRLLISAGWPG